MLLGNLGIERNIARKCGKSLKKRKKYVKILNEISLIARVGVPLFAF